MVRPAFDGGIIFNIDFDSVTFPFLDSAMKEEDFTKETLYPFVDQYAGTQVKALAINTFCQCSATPTKVWDDVLKVRSRKTENGIAVDYSNELTELARCYEEFHIDPYKVWFERTREQGMEAWMSIRMNDCHCPREITCVFRSEFFYEAKKNGWMVGILPGHGLHYHHCYDYAVPQVRQKMLDYIQEQLEMYDVDAVELDFTREIICFKYTSCPDKVEIMNDFIRNVRKIAIAAGEKHGHKIKVVVRLFRDIDQCLAYGFDAETWDKEGLVDHITATSRWWSCDNDMPIDIWKKRCPHIEIGAGVEPNFRPPNNKTDISYRPKYYAGITPDIANGMAAAYISQGADIIYIYNQFINPYVSAEDPWNKRTHTMIRRIGNGETIFNSRRRHVVTFQEQEIVPAGFEAYHPLPMSLSRDETKELSLPIGYVPDGKSARLIIGLSYGTEKNLEIQLNGKRCDTLTECDAETLVSLEANTPGSRMIGEDTTLYMVKIPAESLLRYNLTFTARYDDVEIEYVEVDIQ